MLRRLLPLLAVLSFSFLAACGAGREEPVARVIVTDTPAPLPRASPTPEPTPSPPPTPNPTPTPAPTPTAAPTPAPVQARTGAGLVLGDGIAVWSEPTTRSSAVRRLRNLQEVTVLGSVRGEQWIVGEQTWPMVPHSWTRTWYQLEDGYVYSAHVFIPDPNAASPFVRGAGERAIDVSLSRQRLTVTHGGEAIYTARVTTGKSGYETPAGSYRLWPGSRVLNETMTSSQAAINDPAEEYNVKNVLYTQYFDAAGDALHLNYWQPEGLFGAQPTSHGCVGLFLQDAQWLWLFVTAGTKLTIRS